MEDPTRNYSKNEILAFAQAVRIQEEAFTWLIEYECIELAAVAEYIIYGKQPALQWLTERSYVTLLAFIRVLEQDDAEAFTFLLKSNHKEWAATLKATEDDADAMEWLFMYRLPHFIFLADALLHLARISGADGTSGGYGVHSKISSPSGRWRF